MSINLIYPKVNTNNTKPVFAGKNSVASRAMLDMAPVQKLSLPCKQILQIKGISFKGAEKNIECDFSAILKEFRQMKQEGRATKKNLSKLVQRKNILQAKYPIETRARQTQGKSFYGDAIFEAGYVDFDKIGWDKLKTEESLDWNKASKEEIFALRHVTALAEAVRIPWVKTFNPGNVNQPLSTAYTLNSDNSVERYEQAFNELLSPQGILVEPNSIPLEKHAKSINKMVDTIEADKPEVVYKSVKKDFLKGIPSQETDNIVLGELNSSKAAFLDKPIIDRKTGELNIDFTVFDTETTGLNLNHENNPDYKSDKPPAKIVQIGAVKLTKGGKIKSVVNQIVNPEIPIEEGASEVHGIYDSSVQDKPTIKELLNGNFIGKNKPDKENAEFLKNGFMNYLGDDPIVAYNANFDIPLLNSEIRTVNKHKTKNFVPEKKYSHVIDPFVIIQRIHPFVGASKTLVEQHKYFFGRDVKGAHDALEDVKATVNMFKYCVHYLDKHYTPPKGKDGLTARDILKFQFGEQIPGLNIKLNPNYGFDESKKFGKSYKIFPIGVKNFPGPFKYDPKKTKDEKLMTLLRKDVGETNAKLFERYLPKTGMRYKTEKALRIYLNTLDFVGADGKVIDTKTEQGKKQYNKLVDTVVRDTKNYENYKYVCIRMKNIRPEDEIVGNDLPDTEVVKKVMSHEVKT